MTDAVHTTVRAILEEFDGDPEALAAEVLALRRVVEELRSLHDEPHGPFVIVSTPRDQPEPGPSEPWPMPPRMAAT